MATGSLAVIQGGAAMRAPIVYDLTVVQLEHRGSKVETVDRHLQRSLKAYHGINHSVLDRRPF